MSQAKVDRYKEEKKNRKKTIAREKKLHVLRVICAYLVAIVLIGWAGYSAYHVYESKKPMETIYTNLDAINDYMATLDGDAE